MSRLANLPDGSDVCIDANILVYGLTGASNQCREFLERCSHNTLTGFSLFEILNEATHHFMLAEARDKSLIPSRGGWKDLTPQMIRRLRDYWRNTARALDLNVVFVATDEEVIRIAQPVREQAGSRQTTPFWSPSCAPTACSTSPRPIHISSACKA